ncbi:hypothetical protein [Zobellella sp. An-6]|uniref:hypothetical protein n=1 Tax=Zobellella sp. An-6 TaxID=3400218 RepID=UPI0040423BD7
MTERDLFYGFYAIARLDTGGADPFNEELLIWLTAKAALFGLSNYKIMEVRNAALCAVLNRKQSHHEPSKHSVAIQLSVHTFGRVTKGVA